MFLDLRFQLQHWRVFRGNGNTSRKTYPLRRNAAKKPRALGTGLFIDSQVYLSLQVMSVSKNTSATARTLDV
jgi:hypothetical protein